MFNINQLIHRLQEIKNMGYGDLPLVYSSDDEGNSIRLVENLPALFLVEDLKSGDLIPTVSFDNEGNLIEIQPNCIIIN